jgi:hypothetical protein
MTKSATFQTAFFDAVLDFPDLRFTCRGVCFGFRYSDFGFSFASSVQ